jgi:hypothetical protein
MAPYKVFLTYHRDSALIDWAMERTQPPLPRLAKPLVTIVNELCYYAVLIAVFLHVVRTRREWRAPFQAVGYMTIAYLTFFPAVFNGIPRYHYPALPFLFAYASMVVALGVAGCHRLPTGESAQGGP